MDFEVSPDTLIPKVDTELFVGAVLDELEHAVLCRRSPASRSTVARTGWTRTGASWNLPPIT